MWAHSGGMGYKLDQSFIGHYPFQRTSYRQDRLYVEGYVAGLFSQSVHWNSCLVTGDGQFWLMYQLLLRVLAGVNLVDSWEFSLY